MALRRCVAHTQPPPHAQRILHVGLSSKPFFQYDVYGNRTQKSVDDDGAGAHSAVLTRYALDGWNPAKPPPVGLENFDIWGVFSGAGSLTSRNFHGDRVDQAFARIDGSTPYWNLGDHLGSIRTVLDGSGVVKDSIVYDGYGNITSETDATKRGMYTWTGRELDAETNLQYNRARYYDAATGRWISQDPMGFDAGDSNLYRYVKNQTCWLDPSGLRGRFSVSQVPAPDFSSTIPLIDSSWGKTFRHNFTPGVLLRPFQGQERFVPPDDPIIVTGVVDPVQLGTFNVVGVKGATQIPTRDRPFVIESTVTTAYMPVWFDNSRTTNRVRNGGGRAGALTFEMHEVPAGDYEFDIEAKITMSSMTQPLAGATISPGALSDDRTTIDGISGKTVTKAGTLRLSVPQKRLSVTIFEYEPRIEGAIIDFLTPMKRESIYARITITRMKFTPPAGK